MKSSQSGQWAWKKYGWVAALAACLGAAPSIAYAQAAIAGVVKDASGGVLPGVTVEASSPALIEKTRSAVSDGTGQYRIENLRPGVYSVRFTLTGFTVANQQGVELSGSATISVNADCASARSKRPSRSARSRRWWTCRAPSDRRCCPTT